LAQYKLVFTVADTPRAVQVSLDRPLATGGDMTYNNAGNGYFHAEYPMVHWLESQGYDVS